MNLLFEANYALRLLRKTPGFTTASTVITSVSIAVSIVAFTFIYTLSYKPLQYAEPGLWFAWFGIGGDSLVTNTDTYFYQQLNQREFEHLTVVGGQITGQTGVLSDGDTSQRVTTFYQSPSFFEHKNLTPLLGRKFSRSDTQSSNNLTVMISYDAWQQYYNADANIVGAPTRLNAKLYTIIGVLPKGYNVGFSGDFWLPLESPNLSRPDGKSLRAIIKPRNRDDLSLAKAELKNTLDSLKIEFPDTYLENYQVVLTPLNNLGPGVDSINTLLVLTSIIFILFSCLNTGSLLFTHVLERQQELSIRNAVGSSKWKLISNALMEAIVICAAGTAVGLVFAYFATLKIDSILVPIISANSHFRLSLGLPAILFALSMMMIIWLASGLFPAVRAIRVLAKQSPTNASKGSTTNYNTKTTRFLVGFQVMFTCFLLICSGILIVVMNYVSQRDIGINPENVLVSEIPLSERYQGSQDRLNYLESLAADVSSLSNIDYVSYTSSMPSMQGNMARYQLGDRSFEDNSEPRDPIHYIGNDYFNVLGVPLVAGRAFTSLDNRDSLLVAIVDASFQQRYWPNESAIGKRIKLSQNSDADWITIVGVAGHILGNSRYQADSALNIYLPLRQYEFSDPYILLKHSGNQRDVKSAIQLVATNIDRELPLTAIENLESFYLSANAMGFVVLITRIFFYISVVTLALATTGIFAVLTRSIIQKTRDIGIQRALGANQSKVVFNFVLQGFYFLMIGGGIGVAFGILTLNAIFSSGSVPNTPNSSIISVVITVIVTIASCVLLASYFPARAAVKKEPGDALRYE